MKAFCLVKQKGWRKMNVEMMGVVFARLAIDKTDYLVSNIKDNDREPSWDGDVQVYRKAGDNHKKEDLILKVPVQVKGHKENNLGKQSIKYPVDLSDLRNYLNCGGTTFLVVYVDEDGEKSQIYYNNLLPFELRTLINKYGEQKSKQITLKALPKKKNEIAEIFLFAATHMKKQKAAISCQPVSIEDLISSGQLSGVSFSYTTLPTKEIDPYDYMLNHETYVYAKLPFGLELPVDHITGLSVTEHNKQLKVSVNGAEYYNIVEIKRKKSVEQLLIGKSVVIEFNKKTKTYNIYIKLLGTLSQRIRDLEFIVHFLESSQIEIDEKVLHLSKDKDMRKNLDVLEMKKHLKWLKTLDNLLKELDVNKEIEIDKISKEDDRVLYMLAQSVLNREYIEYSIDTFSPEISIANLRIKLCAHKDEETNKCIFFNYSKSPLIFTSKNEKGDMIKASYHVFLKRESMLKCCNIDFNKVIEDIKQYPLKSEYSDALVCLLLELLHAFDESNKTRDDILEGAVNLSEWLKDFDKSMLKDLLDLNYYQTLKRKRNLNADEIQALHSIIESNPKRQDIYVGAYILLDDFQSAEKHYKELSVEEQDNFTHYPIYNLWKK